MKPPEEKNARKRNQGGIWIIFMSIFIGQLLVYTWSRVQFVKVGYEISQAADTYQQLITNQNNLKVELARLKSPERIAKIAREKLGLTMPNPEQMIMLP
ncbi:MAG: cell division protein FtsL [Desulfobacterales bacterium]|nr:cell division protein FtsL [Desulfobacterales bacterium]